MLITNLDPHKLEACDLLEGEFCLMRPDSHGEGFNVTGVAKIDDLGRVERFRIVSIEQFDESGETLEMVDREFVNPRHAVEIEGHIANLIADNDSLLNEMFQLASERGRPYQACEMMLAKETRECTEPVMEERGAA